MSKSPCRYVSLALSLLMLAAALIGCAATSAPASQSPTAAAATSSTDQPAPDATAGLFNKEGLPIVNQPYTVTIMGIRDAAMEDGFTNVPSVQRYMQETGLTLKWETFLADAWETQKSLVVASNDLPDAFAGGNPMTDNDIMDWSQQGIIIPLKALTEQYAPRFWEIMKDYPVYYKSFVNPQSEFFAFPTHYDIDFGNRGSLYYVSKTIMAKVRPDTKYDSQQYFESVDKSYTTDEFYKILQAIKAADANYIPLSAEGGGDLQLIYWAFNCMENSSHIIVKDGKVECVIGTPEWVAATKYLHTLYSEKLLDQEIFTHNWDTFRGKLMETTPKVGVSLMWSGLIAVPDFADMTDARYKDFAGLKPLIGPGGTQNFYRSADGVAIRGSFAITKACKNPEILIRFQDYLYSEDNSYQSSYGDYGFGLIKKDDGRIDQVFAPKGNITLNSMFITTKEMNSKINYAPATAMAIEGGAVLAKPFQANVAFPKMFFSSEDTAKLAELKTDIDAYYDRMKAQFITDGGVEEGLESFMAELKKMGLDDLVAIYQKNYETYQTLGQ